MKQLMIIVGFAFRFRSMFAPFFGKLPFYLSSAKEHPDLARSLRPRYKTGMKKPILTALAALLCTATLARAELEIATPVVNLGEIRGGMPLDVSFSFRNGGARRIEILEVNRDCNCLTPRLAKRLLEPGEGTRLEMALRTLGHPDGQHAWTASVRYREGDTVREIPLGVRARVINEVTVQPAVCALFVEKTLRQEVTLTDVRKPPLTVTRAETTTRAIKVETKALGGGVTKITLEAAGAGLAPGRHDEMLSIYTSDPNYSQLQVPVTLVRLSESSVLVTPAEVHLVADPGQSISSTLIRLRPRGDQAVVIDKVVADDPAVACTWAAGPGTHATLKIQVTATHSLDTAVRVHLLQPVQETLTIPVRIRFP
jgi:hypothetical protein